MTNVRRWVPARAMNTRGFVQEVPQLRLNGWMLHFVPDKAEIGFNLRLSAVQEQSPRATRGVQSRQQRGRRITFNLLWIGTAWG